APTNRIAINPRIYGVNIANWAADHYARLCAPMLKEAGVSVVRYGATNIERYNWRNNRLYNVISLENQYVPMSWRTFVEWCRDDLEAEAFLQVPAFGQVASDVEASNYNSNQPISEIAAWVEEAGTNVNIWGIGNEPFIAWKLVQYQGDGYKYNDGAHGDQIFLEDLSPEVYYQRWIEIGAAIRGANTNAAILGPTPANWYLYWGTDFSVFCPSTRARSAAWPDHWNPDGHVNDAGWQIMADGMNQFDGRVFPGRAGSPNIIGWEQNPQTGEFNDKRNMNFFAKHVAEYAAANGGTQVCSYLDFHRYMNTDKEGAAVQETRDLWEAGFQSSDQETGYAWDPRILDRFRNLLDHYNPEMGISLSEYDYFYWQGHPNNPQTAALGEVDYLGVFARLGVQLACNWYVGEPDQSGGDYHHAADSAKQALFNEKGEPNPKYWGFRLMSLNFRNQALTSTHVSDNSLFSLYSGVNTNDNELTIVTFYKGLYDSNGAFIEGQGTTNATLVISNFNITGVKSVERFGEYDPAIMTMAPGGVTVVSNGAVRSFDYDFEPLAIYAFTFYGNPAPPAQTAPDTYLNVYPASLAFGAFNTGTEVVTTEDAEHGATTVTNYNFRLRITNNRNTPMTWSISYPNTPWLSVHGATNGEAEVTDLVEFFCDRTGYDVGVYSVDVTVQTSEGTVIVPVSMEVVPGAAGGELRICDFDTGSLGHAWGSDEPYAVGFYDQHGQPADMEWPYIYDMSLDYDEVSSLGGVSSMRIDYDRSNGDNDSGCKFTAFGTYGHKVATAEWVPDGQPLSNYVFKFDVKTETEGFGQTSTKLLVTISDGNGDVGKPSTGISDYKETLSIVDGVWQTVSTPLNGVFYDWKWPGGQTGDVVELDFANISSLSFTPWIGADDRKGTLWIDNIRVESLNDGNRFPVTMLSQNSFEIYTNQTVQLDASASYDPDGTITNFLWSPSTGLSNPNISNPVFTPPSAGTYVFSLEITDNDGLKGRDAAQAIIRAVETLEPSEIILYRDAEMTQPITDGVVSNCFDVYVKYICLSGGDDTVVDSTVAEFFSSDLYGDDGQNNVGSIIVSLLETGTNTYIFTGKFRLAAFSNQSKAELGVSEGSTLTISNLFYEESWEIGSQTFGHETIINHIEDGMDGFNNFGGVWYTYDDLKEGCASAVFLTNSLIEAAPESTQSAYLYAVLGQGVSTNPDVIFAGAGNKITPYTNEIPEIGCTDLSSASDYEGVSFWLKGNGTRVTVVLQSLAVTNYDDYAYTIEHTPTNEWRQYLLPFGWFEQEGWGHEAVARDKALEQVAALQFKFSSHLDGQTNELFIDNIALFGGEKYYMPHAVYNKFNLFSCEGSDGALVNGTFTGAGAPGWTCEGNATIEDWSNWRLVFENWTGTNHGMAYQTVSVNSNKAYQFGLSAFADVGFQGDTYADVNWYDAATNILRVDTINMCGELTTDWQTFTTEWEWAPSNAAFAKIVLQQENGIIPPYTANAVHVDDVTFVE
ncbi:MAG: glycan-binding surface protein, partial [Kiritimatiellae bacterium]|nr:glycan-binding surface protein [Kiritimatiellia bacterium]